ncbi:tryptophan 7-halogenase [Nocardia colli]|uniref:tryptophan 7-halogenase n=1 Tax=Nocardia colli TaxID=2545717 RepID=UPI0035E08FCC
MSGEPIGAACSENVDVVVVGGGPGGSTLAALVAKRGHRVLLLEREKFPRHQIGESLLPSTVHGVCRLSGVADRLADAGFMVKYGGTYRWGANPEPWTFSFSVSPNMPGPRSFAYQVERSVFDQILLEHAHDLGVDVREQCTATGVLEDGGRVRGLAYTDSGGVRREVRARYVVDASGNGTRLAGAVGRRKYSDFFRSLALYGYFEGGKRLPAPRSGNILSAAFDAGWFWYIPLTDHLTSVGAVVRREMANQVQGDPDAALKALIAQCPMIADLLSDARRVTEGQYGRIRTRKDYSYYNTHFWRPGMALIGDAACFIDPVFSTGVHLATYSAMLAARSINAVLAGEVAEEEAFNEFERRYRREYGTFYEYLMSFYDMHVSEDSYFWSAKKVTRSTRGDLESFVDLVGGISSSDQAFLDERAIERTGERSREYAQAVDAMVAGGQESMLPIFQSGLVQEASLEGTQIQTFVELGDDFESPLFAGGLIASPDGLSWSHAGRIGHAAGSGDGARA